MYSSPEQIARQIRAIIDIMMSRISQESRPNSYNSLRLKVKDLNALEISQKQMPASASIGSSITVIKNILNGQDPVYISRVLRELYRLF